MDLVTYTNWYAESGVAATMLEQIAAKTNSQVLADCAARLRQSREVASAEFWEDFKQWRS